MHYFGIRALYAAISKGPVALDGLSIAPSELEALLPVGSFNLRACQKHLCVFTSLGEGGDFRVTLWRGAIGLIVD